GDALPRTLGHRGALPHAQADARSAEAPRRLAPAGAGGTGGPDRRADDPGAAGDPATATTRPAPAGLVARGRVADRTPANPPAAQPAPPDTRRNEAGAATCGIVHGVGWHPAPQRYGSGVGMWMPRR